MQCQRIHKGQSVHLDLPKFAIVSVAQVPDYFYLLPCISNTKLSILVVEQNECRRCKHRLYFGRSKPFREYDLLMNCLRENPLLFLLPSQFSISLSTLAIIINLIYILHRWIITSKHSQCSGQARRSMLDMIQGKAYCSNSL